MIQDFCTEALRIINIEEGGDDLKGLRRPDIVTFGAAFGRIVPARFNVWKART